MEKMASSGEAGRRVGSDDSAFAYRGLMSISIGMGWNRRDGVGSGVGCQKEGKGDGGNWIWGGGLTEGKFRRTSDWRKRMGGRFARAVIGKSGRRDIERRNSQGIG